MAPSKAKRLRDNETIALKEINMSLARSNLAQHIPDLCSVRHGMAPLRRRLKNANEEIERELRSR